MKEGQKNERESLRYLIAWLIGRLEEVKEIKSEDENQFAYGEKTAYADCAECVQKIWSEAAKNGLDFDIEELYPL